MLLIDFLGVCKSYLIENYKNIFFTAIGLIFVISVFSIALNSDYYVRTEYIADNIDSDSVQFPLLEIDTREAESWEFSQETYDETATELTNYISEQAIDNKLGNVVEFGNLSSVTTLAKIQRNDEPELYPQTEVGLVIGSTDVLFTANNFKGRLPTAKDEVIFIQGTNYTETDESPALAFEFDIELGENVTFSRTVTTYNRTTGNFTEITLESQKRVVGIYETELYAAYRTTGDLYPDILVSDDFLVKYPILKPGAFYTTEYDWYADIINNLIIYSVFDRTDYTFMVQLEMDLENRIQPNQFTQTATYINRFFDDLTWESRYEFYRYEHLSWHDIGYRISQFWEIPNLTEISSELPTFTYNNFYSMLPVVSITLFFFYFVNNIFFERRVDQIELFKLRGVTRVHLFGIMVTEGVLNMLFSLPIGFFGGLLLTKTTLNSTSFLDFEFNLSLLELKFSSSIFNIIFLLSLIITIWMVLTRILRLNKIYIADSTNNLENGEPLWKKTYLDVALFVVTLLVNMYFAYQFVNPAAIWETYSDPAALKNFTLLFMPFPVLLLIGGILMLSRVVIPVIKQVSTFTWKKTANLFSYSFMNILRRKDSVIHTILLISLVFALIWAMFSIPPVITMHRDRTTYYEVGADAYISHYWNHTIETEFANDPNIEAYTAIGLYRHQGMRSLNIEFMIIQENFLEVAYFEDGYGSKDAINEIFTQEALQNRSYGVINSKGLEQINKELGDILTLKHSAALADHNITVQGEFSYLPRFILKPQSLYDDPRMVISNKTAGVMLEKHQITFIRDIEQFYYLKLAENANKTALMDQYGVRKAGGIAPDDPSAAGGSTDLTFAEEEIKTKFSLELSILWTNMNILFIVSVITVLLAITLHGFKQARIRSRELSVERSLGMKLSQLIKLFVYETTAIMLFSYVFGSIFGLVFSFFFSTIMIVSLSRFQMLLPKVRFFYPFLSINLILLILILATIAISFVPAWFAKNRDITESLKVY